MVILRHIHGCDSMKQKELDIASKISKVFGIVFMVLSFLFPFIVDLSGYEYNTLVSLLFVVLIRAGFAVASMVMTYSPAFKEKIKLYEVVYAIDVLILILSIITVVLWSLVASC